MALVPKNTQIECIEAYNLRGRYLSALSHDDLVEHFIEKFKAWSKDFQNRALRVANDDANAELAIRGLAPPYHLLEAELRCLSAACLKLVEEVASIAMISDADTKPPK